MATYRQTAEGNWHCQIRKKGYKPVSATFDKKSEAQAWASKVEGQMVSGRWRDRDESDSTTLGEALQRYLDEVSIHKKGHANERYRILAWIADPIAKKPLSQVRSVDLANWKTKRLKVVSGTTARNDLAVISHLFTTARNEWGLNVDNPMDRVQLPKQNKARDRRLEDGELERLLAAAQGARFTILETDNDGKKRKRALPAAIGDVILWAIETGMRAGEIAALEWSDVDVKAGFVNVRDGKTGSRSFMVSSRALSVLEGLPTPINRRQKIFGVTSNALTMSFVKVSKEAGTENLRLHDLRHEATSRLFERGLTIQEVQSITGHKTLQMLMRYTHLRPNEALRAKLG
jgi:integrase